MTLSVVVITFNEEANIGATLASVQELVRNGGEIIVVDSGSTDRTRDIAESMGAKVCVEPWKGFAAQKNSAINKASCDWVLSLDADEVVPQELRHEIADVIAKDGEDGTGRRVDGFWIARMNYIFGRWIRRGGFWPDYKLRLFRRGLGRLEERPVHETIKIEGPAGFLTEPLFHESYPTLTSYIEHMNRYSSLGAKLAVSKGQGGFSVFNIVIRPVANFFYNYIVRLGFLDGREGLLLHLYHASYVSWKYAKAWEIEKASSRK